MDFLPGQNWSLDLMNSRCHFEGSDDRIACFVGAHSLHYTFTGEVADPLSFVILCVFPQAPHPVKKFPP